MSLQIENRDDDTITLRLTGKLHEHELVAMQRDLVAKLAGGPPAAVLIDARSSEGWASGEWSDIEAQAAVDPVVRKMAIVAEPKWEALAAVFPGNYTGARSGLTLLQGKIHERLENSNGTVIYLTGRTSGLSTSMGIDKFLIELK